MRLIQAASNGDITKVKSLAEEGIDVNATDKIGNTALISAAINGHKIIVQYLLSIDVIKPDALILKQQLEKAILSNQSIPVKGLLFLADKSELLNQEILNDLLLLAVKTNSKLAIVKQLKKAGAEPELLNLNREDLITAARKSQIEWVKILLMLNIIDVNEQDSKGYTALMWAASGGHFDMVEMLIAAGANSNTKNKYDMIAFTFAAANNKKGADEVQFRLLSEMSARELSVISETSPDYARLVCIFKDKVHHLQKKMLSILGARSSHYDEGDTSLIDLPLEVRAHILSKLHYPAWYAHRVSKDLSMVCNGVDKVISNREVKKHSKIVAFSQACNACFSGRQYINDNDFLAEKQDTPLKRSNSVLL